MTVTAIALYDLTSQEPLVLRAYVVTGQLNHNEAQGFLDSEAEDDERLNEMLQDERVDYTISWAELKDSLTGEVVP